MNLKVRLALMNFLEFAVWGAYLTSMGRYLGNIGIGPEIGLFYSMQGVVSIFMPALMGIVADRWVPAQRLLGFCHLVAGLFMFATAGYGLSVGGHAEFSIIFTLLYADAGTYQLCCLQCPDECRHGHGEGLSPDTCIRNDRIHPYHVAGRPSGLPEQPEPVCHFRFGEHHSVSLYLYAAEVRSQ